MPKPQTEFDKTKYKLIALDLDGTMLHMGGIHPHVERVLGNLSARGIEIVIATGRSLPMVPSSVLAMPFLRYAVTSSGARVTDLRSKAVLGQRDIDTKTALKAIHVMRKLGATANISCDTVNIFELKSFLAMRRHMPAVSKAIAGDFLRDTKLAFFPAAVLRRVRRPVEKLNFYFKDADKCVKGEQLLQNKFPFEVVSTMGRDLEVSEQGVNKAVGLLTLCQHLGLQMSEVIAIGDSANDIDMLSAVGYPIAMGNAPDNIKQLTSYVAPPVSENGVAAALTELFCLGND